MHTYTYNMYIHTYMKTYVYIHAYMSVCVRTSVAPGLGWCCGSGKFVDVWNLELRWPEPASSILGRPTRTLTLTQTPTYTCTHIEAACPLVSNGY